MPELHNKSFHIASGQVSNSQMLLFVWGGTMLWKIIRFSFMNSMKNKKAQVELQHDVQRLPVQSFNVPWLSRGAGGLRGTLTG